MSDLASFLMLTTFISLVLIGYSIRFFYKKKTLIGLLFITIFFVMWILIITFSYKYIKFFVCITGGIFACY